jgi:tRNA (guanine37-N1)-methyltransferase
MISFDIISANPKILESSLKNGLIYRAQNKNLISVESHDLRDYAKGKYKQIDDEPYGGGAGMILKPEPFFRCIEEVKEKTVYNEIIYFSPQGKIFDQQMANRYSLSENLLLLCGHYKGIDQRVIDKYVTVEISIGNYVISGGEFAALIFMDAVSRLIPGVLNDAESAITDSFQNNEIFDSPHYTRPELYEGMKVPEILLSGNHSEIRKWREEQSKRKFKQFKKKIKKDK